ncbi:MAG TPA: PRC-barrel domain-containing protein [Arenibaculum sp.]|nr:PRC-barrel domain-containing protein [Arenibaculum sp.]
MFWNFETLRDYGLHATDGHIGQISDIYFDDRDWTVRYVVVDTGTWLPGRKVLIPPGELGEPEPGRRDLPIGITRQQVKDSPDISTDRPVSRQEEESLHAYYGWAPYWGGPMVAGWGGIPAGAPMVPPPGSAPVPPTGPGADARPQEETHGDPHLRSGREIEGYHIAAEDGSIGHVEDYLIDHAWHVRYLIIDTRNWLPGRKVVVAPDWVRRIDWAAREVEVDLTREQIRNSPEYDPLTQLDRGFEQQLYGYYGRMPYWI